MIDKIHRHWLEKLSHRRLAPNEQETLHSATLEVLADVGLRFPDAEALRVFKEGGATVTEDVVQIPRGLVDWALDTAPKELTLFDQSGKESIQLEGRCAYFGNGSDLLFVLDRETGDRRLPTVGDVIEIIRLLDSLENLDFVMSGFLPRDVETEKAELIQMRIMLQYTNKPIVYVTTDLTKTKKVVEMAEVVAGGESRLQKRPFAACYINIANPLRHNPESIRKLIWLSLKGLPLIYRPALVTRGVSTPISPAGFLAVQNAASLSGLVLSQLANEGTPFIRDACSGGTFDMRYMVGQHSAPEIRGFNEDLLHFYGLPGFGIGGTTGAKVVDQQAALEAALTLLTSTQAGAQLIHDVGYMDNGTTGSSYQLAICSEIISWIKAYVKPININEETLAMDEIRKVAMEEGDFLGSDNTVRFFRDDYYPELLDRQNYDSWVENGCLTLEERARLKVDEILSQPAKRYTSSDQLDHLQAIIDG